MRRGHRYWAGARSPLIALLLASLMLTPLSVGAREAILDFHSELLVQSDAQVLVQETIRVRAEGQEIRRGIYRDFPTDYRDRYGNRYRVGFDVLGVQRDGRDEPYRTERRANGVRLYIGDENVLLRPGEHEFLIRYRTNRQIGFFERHDELYWNVTGNAWSFPIRQTSARVRLPASVPPGRVQGEGYTGPTGSTGRDYRVHVDSAGDLVFRATRPLAAREGLTIVATWPKGHVTEPGAAQRLGYFVAANHDAVAGAAGLLVLLVYYTLCWLAVGRDPAPGVIVTRYEPPEGYSPAALRYVRRMGYDHKTFATALVNLAVKGYLDIVEEPREQFRLEKRGAAKVAVAPGEGAIASALFGAGGDRVELEQTNHRLVAKALAAHRRALGRHFEKVYFLRNAVYLVPGVLISLGVIGATVLAVPGGEQRALAGFMSIWLTGWTLGVFALLRSAWTAWRAPRRLGRAVFTSLFAVPFLGFELFGIGVLVTQGSTALAGVLLGVVAANWAFYHLLKAPTLRGRRLTDQAEGFRDYLAVAEREELGYRHPEEGTAELFERYLPYALALDVEQAWAARFAGVLDGAGRAEGSYHPRWYRGSGFAHRDFAGIAGGLGAAMNSAIASSSTAPGSASGGGGGGSSGGGGGGGGGGGW
ncbi:MAG: DUF2207 domain-containing protein [Gammaproteobacteria bacterium]